MTKLADGLGFMEKLKENCYYSVVSTVKLKRASNLVFNSASKKVLLIQPSCTAAEQVNAYRNSQDRAVVDYIRRRSRFSVMSANGKYFFYLCKRDEA